MLGGGSLGGLGGRCFLAFLRSRKGISMDGSRTRGTGLMDEELGLPGGGVGGREGVGLWEFGLDEEDMGLRAAV